jgi:CMP-N,N'-diacetyllegionaminic acid synthase
VSVVEVEHAVHPAKFKVMQDDRLLPYLEEERGRMASHELPRVYVRNCSVYATRRTVIDCGQVIGADCRGYLMPRERSLDINDEMDFALAEFMLTRLQSTACGLSLDDATQGRA